MMRNNRRSLTRGLVGAAFCLMVATASAAPGAAADASAAGDRTVSLAVVPFQNVCEDAQADRKILGILVTQLLSTGAFTVTEPAIVESVLSELRARGQLDAAQMRQVAEKTGVRLLLMGTVTEFGQARSSSNSAVTVAIDARLVDVGTSRILWAGMVNKTEKETEGFLIGGSTPSLSKVTQKVVQQLVGQMVKDRRRLMALATPVATPAPALSTSVSAAPRATTTASTASPNVSTRLKDEAQELTRDDLKALLPALDGFERGPVTLSEHAGPRAETTYKAGTAEVRVKLADYGKVEQARNVVRVESGQVQESSFEDLPAYTPSSFFGAARLNVAAGRVGLYLRAVPGQEETVKKVASALLKGMR